MSAQVHVPSTREWTSELRQARSLAGFDSEKEPEIQTDKVEGKLVPCRGCQRPLLVNRFYSAAQASCSDCGLSRALGGGSSEGPATVREDVLAESRERYPRCRCEELGLRAGMPVAELVELEAGCTGSLGRRRLGTFYHDYQAGWVCDRLNLVRRRHGK